jgi:hypothetical protein
MSINLLSTLNKKNYTLRRSARLLATIDVGHGGVNEPLSRGVQTSKRKCAVAINRPPLELQSEPDVDDLLALKKRGILGKEHVDPDHENTRPSKRKRGPHVEPVYIIPNLVEKKKTTFRGRLG